MPTTERGYPYPAPSDAPNGPAQIQALAQAVDADVTAVALSLTPQQDEDSTNITGVVSNSYIPGAPVVKVVFVAPPSGRVAITVTGTVQQSSNGNRAELGWIMKTGSVVGSGTDVVLAGSDRAIIAGEAVNTSSVAVASASKRWMKTALTPGNTYHVYTVHRTTPAGSASLSHRAILVEPLH